MLQMDTVLEPTADDVNTDLPDVMVIDLTPLMLRSARDSVITRSLRPCSTLALVPATRGKSKMEKKEGSA